MTLINNEKIQSQLKFEPGRILSSILIPEIRKLFSDSGITTDDVDIFGICIGPGIFTGIRVGMASMKGILFGKKPPVVPVSSLECAAFKISNEKGTIASLIDAHRNSVYAASYTSGSADGQLRQKTAPVLTGIEQVKFLYKAEERVVFTGSGANIHKDQLSSDLKNSEIREESPYLSEALAKIALIRYKRSSFFKGMRNVTPMYLRRPDAEKKKS